MSAIIDDKVVAGAKNSNTVKEDPIVALTVCKIYYIYAWSLHHII